MIRRLLRRLLPFGHVEGGHLPPYTPREGERLIVLSPGWGCSEAGQGGHSRRAFWVGLVMPAAGCAMVALAVGPDTWVGWMAVSAIAPAAAAGVALQTVTRRHR